MLLFSLITLAAVFGIIGFHIRGNLRKIQSEWSTHRCNPAYVFVPAFVNVGVDVATNFNSCLNMAGSSVTGQMNDAIGSQMSIVGESLSEISNPLALFRQMINTMRNFTVSFASSTLGKASGPVSMFVYYLNKIQDLMRRMVGEGYIAALFGVSVVSFMQGFVSLLLGVIKVFVIAMLVIAVILSLLNFPMLVFVIAMAASLGAAGA